MKILMPQLGETVNEGTISAWYKSPGDPVEKDETLMDVETDKVATEIPSPASGTLAEILVAVGETVDVGTVLAVLSGTDEDEDAGQEPVSIPDSSAGAESATAPVETSSKPANTSLAAGSGLSPAVRRLASQHNLDLGQVTGTARNGRISKKDVLAFIESQANAVSREETPARAEGNHIPFDRIRRQTAEHMVRSKATSAHVLQAIEVDFSSVDAVRLPQKAAWKEKQGFSLSYLPFIAHAVCNAIASWPRVNSSVEDDALKLHGTINLAIAVDLDHQGLVAPVMRNCAGKSVSELAMNINELVAKARRNALGVDDLSGGTYTIPNPGPFGTLFTAPIINQPQVAILSTDVIQKKPVVIESAAGDAIAIRPVGVLAQSFDHRAIDGAYSAAYLAKLKQLIEQTDWSTEF